MTPQFYRREAMGFVPASNIITGLFPAMENKQRVRVRRAGHNVCIDGPIDPKIVLDAISATPMLTRSQISQQLGLTAWSSDKVVRSLLKMGVISEMQNPHIKNSKVYEIRSH